MVTRAHGEDSNYYANKMNENICRLEYVISNLVLTYLWATFEFRQAGAEYMKCSRTGNSPGNVCFKREEPNFQVKKRFYRAIFREMLLCHACI